MIIICALVSSFFWGSQNTSSRRTNELALCDRDFPTVSHFTLHSTKRSSAAPAWKIPCPLLPCFNSRQWKWPFCILVWRIHHWLLSDRVLDEWDHLSVAAWQSLGSAVTIWGVCLYERTCNCHIMAWLGVGGAAELSTSELQMFTRQVEASLGSCKAKSSSLSHRGT